MVRITTNGNAVTIDVAKGEEVYRSDEGGLFERATLTRSELTAELHRAEVEEKARAANAKAAEKAAAKAAASA